MIKLLFCVTALLLLASCAYSEKGLSGDQKLCEGYCAGKTMSYATTGLYKGEPTCLCSKTIMQISEVTY